MKHFELHSIATIPQGNILIVEYSAEYARQFDSGEACRFVWFDYSDLISENATILLPGDRVLFATAEEAVADAKIWSKPE